MNETQGANPNTTEKSPRSVLGKISKHLGHIVLGLNVLAILLVWVSCASTWLHPENHPRLAILGLAFPVFVLVNLGFIIAWIPINYRRAWIPLAGLLPCISFLIDYCPISFKKTVPDGCIKVLTWNTDGLGSAYEDKDEGHRIAIDYIKESDADIVCLQEGSLNGWSGIELKEYMDSAGYELDTYIGNVLFTRFPILESDTIHYDTDITYGAQGNGSKWYLLKYENDTILLVNNHLESNHLRKEVKDRYVETLDKPEIERLKESGHNIGTRLVHSNALRGPQADSIAAFVEQHPCKNIIMCGDFNDTPISYTYQRLTRKLNCAFRQSGNGIGISYNQRGFWVRIDHIFVSDNCNTYHTHIDNSINVSDHYPLISWLKFE